MTTLAPMSRGKEIKMARVERGYTQSQLADICGFQHQEISQYEKGRIPKDKRLEIIAKALGKEWKLTDKKL